jgi:hypothetical protein
MAKRSVLASALTVLLALPAAPAGAVAGHRLECSESSGAFGAREVRFGPAWIRNADEWADPSFFATRRDPATGLYGTKSPLSLHRGVTATVSIARRDRPYADFKFVGSRRADVLRVSACPRNGRRGDAAYTTWPGGFRLTEPRCVTVSVRRHDNGRVDRATLSFGMGDACDTAPAGA